MIADWTTKEIQYLYKEVPKTGLKTRFRDKSVGEMCQDVIALSKRGLQARGLNEEKFLYCLEEIVSQGQTRAEDLLESFHFEWEGQLDPVFLREDLWLNRIL
eukprot:TRINITY_DN98587_c0_g1_i1.p2 TRINITY_DN98587_c0_g1~~TRINITY_DN98587_c0_g1_i1.p2  ORF type:complete len:115 (-),score=13.70 TRINITY_DN98587_c0_g1_i1:118-423(-)